ncbi:MAG: hypothetical protein HZR80_06450 [Candidatus Heimdallarchaeota archaeon]
MQKRRSPLTSIKEIFSLLENEPQNMQSICNKLSFSWEQLENYLQLIHFIQEQSTLVDKKLGQRSRILFLEQEAKRNV